ncbi:S-layer homology domain-containing protein [Candidatus Villigracilis affinis]|uniref:S-layer homology domain-containing protein n=1 Tax=Candidatus Villigracilis affinis TaxID=3140682 RepID=UPI001DC2A01B|nr:S-layer homology domain-containing protein [Anaerolineales bacterium]
MSKKVFTLLLVAVFALAQFSVASAVQVTADGTLVGPDFMPAGAGATVTLDWTATGLPAGTTYVDIYARLMGGTYAIGECQNVAVIVGTSNGSGTFDYVFTGVPADGEYWEFLIAFDDTASCTTLPADPAVADNFMASSYVDGHFLDGFGAIPPNDGTILTPVACNTFEYWAIATDTLGLAPAEPYAGFGAWNPQITGTFAPAPIGPENELLSWVFTLPATAAGTWTFSISPEDAAGNNAWTPIPYYFRFPTAIAPAELEDCATFTDISGHASETYVRYLATLGLISGFADGTFGPDTTLTRAEASTLIEISNGYDDTMLPTSAPAGCDFTDVAASDWFAGWVWQACDDGYMNGIGGGLFDPNNLLTRGQIVTIINNAYNVGGTGGFLAAPFSVLNFEWTNIYREAAWSDVSVGAFYAVPVVNAYGVGVAEGTSATTFSPDQPVTRGEFAQMLYRALSLYFGGF